MKDRHISSDALPGFIYWHYKGGKYLVIGVATTHNHIEEELDVVYVSLTHGSLVTRPLYKDARKQDSWTDIIKWPDGVERCRFTRSSKFDEKDLEALHRVGMYTGEQIT
jgi:hypothetical protein